MEASPLFSTILRLDMFLEALEQLSTVDQLNTLRNGVLNHNRRNHPHPLRDPKYGFSAVFKALDTRATELGFIKLSTGYRKSLSKTTNDMAKKITPEVALIELERELGVRERYYPEWSKGPSPKLKPETAEHRIDCIKWAIANLKQQIAGTKGQQQTLF